MTERQSTTSAAKIALDAGDWRPKQRVAGSSLRGPTDQEKAATASYTRRRLLRVTHPSPQREGIGFHGVQDLEAYQGALAALGLEAGDCLTPEVQER